MNKRATAYLRKHGAYLELDGRQELMLPLDKLQGFLDLLTPADVPPEKLQKLYAYQAEVVKHISEQTTQRHGQDER